MRHTFARGLVLLLAGIYAGCGREDRATRSMLHGQVTPITRARFPAVDFHQHLNDGQISENRVSPEKVVDAMDELNIATMVILTGGWGGRLEKMLRELVDPYPGRFVVFTQIDGSRIDEPDFGEEMVDQIGRAVSRGARGLKVLKDLGLTIRDKSGKIVPVDDPRLDPIWEACGRLGIPVAMHVSDPEAFFEPIDPENERYEELIRNPEWSWFGAETPTKEEILAARDRVFARHPDTTFVALHVGNWPENLDHVSAMLDRFPNVFVELGARQAELGRQPRRARRFVIDHQDRVLFGTDLAPSVANRYGRDVYHSWFRWLESADEYFPYYGYPRQGRWYIYGLELPEDVLEKVYFRNARRVLSLSGSASP